MANRMIFTIGDRVEASEAAYAAGIFPNALLPVHGTVTGFGRLKFPLVRVDGTNYSERYNPIFWARIEEGA